jgi:hypothetical protein
LFERQEAVVLGTPAEMGVQVAAETEGVTVLLREQRAPSIQVAVVEEDIV